MKQLALLVAAMLCATTAVAQSAKPVPVTADNFTRAETDTYFANIVAQAGGTGKFFHRRELEPVDNQIVIRANRDTVYSAAVFDLDAGPVTVTLPDAGKRLRSMIVIDEDQYTPVVVYEAGRYTYTKAQIGTRYLMLALRTLVDPTTPGDIERVRALQDATRIDQAGWARPLRKPELGSGQPQAGARCAAGARLDAARLGPWVRHQGRGRSGAAPDSQRLGLGRKPRQREVPQRDSGEERRQDGTHAGRP